jgi:hypothetical protein
VNAPTIPPGTGLQSGDAFDVHRQMVLSLFVATLFLSVALSVGLWFSSVTMLMLVAAAGALGGFVSGLRRLYAFQRVFPVHFFKTRRRVDAYLIVYSMIPSLVGAIAAVTLYLIFASQLVKGDMFPAFHLSAINPKSDDFQNFIWNWQPVTSADFAKALVWSFLAGFSERFVPDLLDRLASSQQPKDDEPDHRATDTPEERRHAAARRRSESRPSASSSKT